VSDDELELVHIFRLKWGTEGKVPRFVIDGRRYDHPEAVRADLREAARALSRLHIAAEFETARPAPTTVARCRAGASSARVGAGAAGGVRVFDHWTTWPRPAWPAGSPQ
jgi:hypothetical protein